jgi:hypothetical protein
MITHYRFCSHQGIKNCARDMKFTLLLAKIWVFAATLNGVVAPDHGVRLEAFEGDPAPPLRKIY